MDYLEIVHLGTEVFAEVRNIKVLKPGESEQLPPIIFKVNGKHYQLDAKATRLPEAN